MFSEYIARKLMKTAIKGMVIGRVQRLLYEFKGETDDDCMKEAIEELVKELDKIDVWA